MAIQDKYSKDYEADLPWPRSRVLRRRALALAAGFAVSVVDLELLRRLP